MRRTITVAPRTTSSVSEVLSAWAGSEDGLLGSGVGFVSVPARGSQLWTELARMRRTK